MTSTTDLLGADERARLFQRIIKPRVLADPYPDYAELFGDTRVLESPLPQVLDGILLSSYEDCLDLVRSRSFGALDAAHLDMLGHEWRSSGAERVVRRAVGFRNSPQHQHFRAAMAPHFTPRRIAALRDSISATVDEVLGSLTGREADLVADVARPLPAAVMGSVFGIDRSTTRELVRLGEDTGAILDPIRSPAQNRRMEASTLAMVEIFDGLIAERRAAPDDTLLSSIVEAFSRDGEEHEDLVGNLVFLFTAGHETLTGFLGLALRALLDEPAQADLLRHDPDLASSAVEELLRFDAPVQMLFRMADEPAVLGDRKVQPGTLVIGLVGAAHRDPQQFTAPARLDLTRDGVRPLSFGAGPHYCLGAALARLEAEVLLPRLLRAFPGMRPCGSPRFRSPGVVLRGLETLPVLLR